VGIPCGIPRQPQRREFLDLDAALGSRSRAIAHRPHLALASADEGHDPLLADSHVSRVRDQSVQVDVNSSNASRDAAKPQCVFLVIDGETALARLAERAPSC
jgi:hypothetical protein